jgi:hypothetical protein
VRGRGDSVSSVGRARSSEGMRLRLAVVALRRHDANRTFSLATANMATRKALVTTAASSASQVALETGFTAADARHALVEALRTELVGPSLGDDEVLAVPPSRQYVTGILASVKEDQATLQNETEDEIDDNETVEDDETDDPVPDPTPKRRFLPSSMGLSFMLERDAKLYVDLSFATYSRVDKKDSDGGAMGRAGKWQRVQNTYSRLEVPVGETVVSPHNKPGIRIQVQRTEVNQPKGQVAVSVFVINEMDVTLTDPTGLSRAAEEARMFQVRLRVTSDARFAARDPLASGNQSSEKHRLAIQYRHVKVWGSGHNASLVPEPGEGERPIALCTDVLPQHEVPNLKARAVHGLQLGMKELAALEHHHVALRDSLMPLVLDWARWSEQQILVNEADFVTRTAQEIQDEIRACIARVHAGIELLFSDARARQVFCLANKAMFDSAMSPAGQRRRSGEPSWRPFQLAFLLLNLAPLLNDKHPSRECVELLFFPTGGGKTEAYLGVIACTLIWRRLRDGNSASQGAGTAVILRYTLRMLTLDQLERACLLVCAMELMRREKPSLLGETPFSIGLWVGKSATANYLKDFKQELIDCKTGARPTLPVPLPHCPWCATPLEHAGVDLDIERRRVRLRCQNSECAFGVDIRNPRSQTRPHLPLAFVDEHIYAWPPSVLIGTVDKFAMLPWRGEAGTLFGRVSRQREDGSWVSWADEAPKEKPIALRPPELIIQDELHLITGPLGSMVGLYEAFIEGLMTTDGLGKPVAKPRIIASTATAAGADKQVVALFGRSTTQQFPPQSIASYDNYFTHEDPSAVNQGRLYLGVSAPGRTFKALLVKVYATLLCAAQRAHERNPTSADAYMTVIGYFNALRELSSMRRLVEDDVRGRTQHAMSTTAPGDNHARPGNLYLSPRQLKGNVTELTSRESSSRLSDARAALNNAWSDKDGGIDVVLATNMISVGIDISRLGLMVMAGPPKTTSEYIQASSRVGRSPKDHGPGLVVVCYNPARPRDRSHYERFQAFHQQFYRFVEAQSMTPFSSRALDIGLKGAMVALVRHLNSRVAPDSGVAAAFMGYSLPEEPGTALRKRLQAAYAPGDGNELYAQVTKALEELHQFIHKSSQLQNLVWGNMTASGKIPWFVPRGTADSRSQIQGTRPEEIPTSMRDVEPSVPVLLFNSAAGERGEHGDA